MEAYKIETKRKFNIIGNICDTKVGSMTYTKRRVDLSQHTRGCVLIKIVLKKRTIETPKKDYGSKLPTPKKHT